MADPSTTIPLTGPLFVGAIINWFLFGVLCVQGYIYSLHCSNDRVMIKATVILVFAMDIAQTGLATDWSWKTLVQHWGDPTILSQPPPDSISITIMAALVSAVVQFFFAWRIWILNEIQSKGKWFRIFPVLIVMVCLPPSHTDALFDSIYQGLTCPMHRFVGIVHSDNDQFAFIKQIPELEKLTVGFTVWLAGSFTADIIIAGCMLYLVSVINHIYDNAGLTAVLDTILTRLMRNTIQTGAITVIAAGIELVLFLTTQQANYHVTPAYLLGKLYSNVLLANLNARSSEIGASINTTQSSTLRSNRTTSVKLGRMGNSRLGQGSDSHSEGIGIHTEVIKSSTHHDLEEGSITKATSTLDL
ncbi:hypothetical protein ONZ45_g18721 [Pleurotus djamor]|nr:hypothetical protein ONZ45_g18721 [Pleurotus djamor]